MQTLKVSIRLALVNGCTISKLIFFFVFFFSHFLICRCWYQLICSTKWIHIVPHRCTFHLSKHSFKMTADFQLKNHFDSSGKSKFFAKYIWRANLYNYVDVVIIIWIAQVYVTMILVCNQAFGGFGGCHYRNIFNLKNLLCMFI